MLFRFGVILTPDCADLEVFALGSRPEMGHWDPSGAIQMKATRAVPSKQEPCLWIGEVQLAEPCQDSLWFKFIKRVKGSYVWEGRISCLIVQCTLQWLSGYLSHQTSHVTKN